MMKLKKTLRKNQKQPMLTWLIRDLG
jgi:hypothetical protein